MIPKPNNQPRKATHKDEENILNVIGSYREAKWDKPIAKKYYDDFFKYPELFKADEVYVVEEDKKIVSVIGYCQDRYESNNYWLGWFYTHSDYRGRGFGGLLFDFVKNKLKNLKVKRLFVDTSSNGLYEDAINLYEKFGFKLEATIKNYYEKDEHQLIYSMDL